MLSIVMPVSDQINNLGSRDSSHPENLEEPEKTFPMNFYEFLYFYTFYEDN